MTVTGMGAAVLVALAGFGGHAFEVCSVMEMTDG